MQTAGTVPGPSRDPVGSAHISLGLLAKFRLEDLFEKSDMKMENMGSESSKKLKCCRENIICGKIKVSRARCPSKLCCSLAGKIWPNSSENLIKLI